MQALTTRKNSGRVPGVTKAVIALFLLVIFSVPIRPAIAQSLEDFQRQAIFDRLIEQAERLDVIMDERPALEAVLLPTGATTTDKDERRNAIVNILDEWIGQGSPLARLTKDVFSPSEINNYLNRGFKARPDSYFTCLFQVVENRAGQNARDLRETASGIQSLNLDEIYIALQIFSKRPEEQQESADELDTICGDLNPDGNQEAVQSVTYRASISWDASCHQGETPQNNPLEPLTLPTVAELLYDRADGSGPRAFCTGTLIAPNLVLTAAHCFCHAGAKQTGGRFFRTAKSCARGGAFIRAGSARRTLDPRDHAVFFQHGGLFGVKRVILHPDFRWTGRLPRADLALVVLDGSLRDFPPTPINSLARLQPRTFSLAAGFGYHRPLDSNGIPAGRGELRRETGLKFEGPVLTDRCRPDARRRGMICWTFREQAGQRFLGSTCNGDSGGPIFAERGGRRYLVGVTSAGGRNCRIGSRAWNFSTYHFRGWIAQQIRLNGPAIAVNTPNYREQLICSWCQSCDTDETAPWKSDDIDIFKRFKDQENKGYLVKIDSASAQRLRVSLNCSPDATNPLMTLRVQNENLENQSCVASGVGAAFSCETPAQQNDRFRVHVTGGLLRECQIVATAYSE